MLESVTLDQLRMLVAIVDTGSFTAAAKKVQRGQSAVSQAIANLEFQLDLKLFDRSTKRPRLTDAGATIVGDARAVIDRSDALKAKAKALSGGLEAQVSLAVSMLTPIESIADTLQAFGEAFPSVALNLFVQEAGGPMDMVLDGEADIGVIGAFNMTGPGLAELVREPLPQIDIIAVTGADHPLATLGRTLTEADLRDQRQILSASRRGAGTPNPLSLDVWHVADQRVRRVLIERGFGWGIMPRHLVQASLDAGLLKPIALTFLSGDALHETLYAISRQDRPLGRAGLWLVDRLRAAW